jgi:hypothetical protein
MDRGGDNEVYMTDGFIAHMMIEGTMIELSRYYFMVHTS